MELKIKKVHPDATIPAYAKHGDACFDITAVDVNGYTIAQVEAAQAEGRGDHIHHIPPGGSLIIDTGLQFEVEEGYVLKVYSRSGHGFTHGIRLKNGTGILDSGYRGNLKVALHNDSTRHFGVKSGDRIAQAMIEKVIPVEFKVVEELSASERGANGFGSTGLERVA